MKVIGLVCSPRRKKHTYDFVDLTLRKLEEKGVETALLYLRDYKLKPCVLCEVVEDEEYPCLTQDVCPRKDEATKLYKELNSVDGIVVGTPVFNGTIPEYLHSLISHAGFPARYCPFNNKVTACIVIGWLGCIRAVSELMLWLAPGNYFAGYLAINNRSPSLQGEKGLVRAPQNIEDVEWLVNKIYEGLQRITKTTLVVNNVAPSSFNTVQ
jgi:multimeric flavodoxin WrbA